MGLFNILFGGGNSTRIGSVRSETEDRIRIDWEAVRLLLNQKGPSQLKQALITADKSLDNALRDMVVGESMGERLKNGRDLLDSQIYQKIWDAHKLRNNIVHESNFDPPYFMVLEAVNNLKEGLRSLGVKV